MKSRIVVLGNGPSGTLAANRLRRHCPAEQALITVIDRIDTSGGEAALLTALGVYGPHALHAPEDEQLRDGIAVRHAEVSTIDPRGHEVFLADGTTVAYDVLVVATGAPGRACQPGGPSRPCGAPCLRRSPGLGDANGFVRVDPRTQRSLEHPDVYAVGAATGRPAAASGSVHVQAENLARAVAGLTEATSAAAPSYGAPA